MMKHIPRLCLLLYVCLITACNGFQTEKPAENPEPSVSQGICGDDVCDGPENKENCSKDCDGLPTGPSNQQEQPVNGAASDQQQSSNATDGYRFVSFGGTIQTSYDTQAMGDFTGTVLEYSGEYQVRLWFPINGGPAVQQDNTITLNGYESTLIGEGCDTCQWNLNLDAYEPVSFELQAKLGLDVWEEEGEPADELSYQLIQTPMKVLTGEVTCCGEPGPINDPAAFPTLLGWFMQGIKEPIQLNVIENNSVDNFSVMGVYLVTIPNQTLSYTIVADLNTP